MPEQIGWEANGRILCWQCATERYGNGIKDHTVIYDDEFDDVFGASIFCEDCGKVLEC